MDNTWTYREGIDAVSNELIGYDVEASDGHIGKIDESSLDAGATTWWSTPGSGSSARRGSYRPAS